MKPRKVLLTVCLSFVHFENEQILEAQLQLLYMEEYAASGHLAKTFALKTLSFGITFGYLYWYAAQKQIVR